MASVKEKLRSLEDLSTPRKHTVLQGKKPLPEYIPEIDARVHRNDHGYVIIRERTFPLDWVHGIRLDNFLKISGREFSLIAKNSTYSEILPQQVLFLDTETTGLAGGTGTLIFLIGFGYLQDNSIRIKQFFIDEYKNERAFLVEINKLMQNFQAIGSFNGKSYDLPLLRTRFVLNRLDFAFEKTFHLDLLHPARRLWKKRLVKCDLQNIERKILGFRRSDDIPGAGIPARYFAFLQNRDFAPIKPIFQHNAMDILTLFSVAIFLSHAFQGGSDVNVDDYDIFGLLKSYEDMGLYRDCIRISREQADNVTREQSFEILLKTARNHKKLGDLIEAEKLWIQIIENSPKFSAEPYIELAKLYEHKRKKIADALQIIERLEKRLHIIRELELAESNTLDSVDDDLGHRKTRLVKKLAKIAESRQDGK